MHPTDYEPRQQLEDPTRARYLRFSIAGIQLKFSALEQSGKKGLTIPVRGIGGEEADSVEFMKRLEFNALIGNADMHLKN